MPLDPRTEYHRVIIRSSRAGLVAESTGGQRSSRVASLSGANGLVVLPPKKEGGPKELRESEMAEAILIGEIMVQGTEDNSL
jgi:gephyrin